jgi:hypothetical protein
MGVIEVKAFIFIFATSAAWPMLRTSKRYALLFLYKQVLQVDLRWMDELPVPPVRLADRPC